MLEMSALPTTDGRHLGLSTPPVTVTRVRRHFGESVYLNNHAAAHRAASCGVATPLQLARTALGAFAALIGKDLGEIAK